MSIIRSSLFHVIIACQVSRTAAIVLMPPPASNVSAEAAARLASLPWHYMDAPGIESMVGKNLTRVNFRRQRERVTLQANDKDAGSLASTVEAQTKIAALQTGKCHVGTDGRLIEYRINRTSQRFEQYDVQRALQDKWLYFYGDSRLRFIFAAFLALFGGEDLPSSCPRHRACPYNNEPGAHVDACAEYYFGDEELLNCLDITIGRTRLTYEKNHWAKPLEAHTHLAIGGTPDVLFVNNGAWSVYYDYGHEVAAAENTEGYESHLDRLLFYRAMAGVVGPSALKVMVGYPMCNGAFGPPLQETTLGVERQLALEGWVVYNAGLVTDRQCWGNLSDPDLERNNAKSWNTPMVPLDSLPEVTKWDQCEGPHTYDTLSDLEVQVLLNSIVASSPSNHGPIGQQ
eukprot:TRINITY_DN62995_c0_g1_i1.p1 TRINITY_DN62995_c0_g1~~TRINITY_DN62995_c0_g1_i1.p1  ORF type:complete len:400 (-),score=75.73 TRINITY_DN62995_c0_g1_i1:64-1263(-)